MGGDRKMRLRPLFEAVQVSRFKIPSGGCKMKDPQRDAEPRGQIAEEELPDRGLRLQQLVDKFGIEQDVQCLEILPLFQKTVRRTLP